MYKGGLSIYRFASFKTVAGLLDSVKQTSSRLKKAQLLVDFFSKYDPECRQKEVKEFLRFLEFSSQPFAMISGKRIANTFYTYIKNSSQPLDFEAVLNEKNDLAEACAECWAIQRRLNIDVVTTGAEVQLGQVLGLFEQLKACEDKGSVMTKEGLMVQFFSQRCSHRSEVEYLVKALTRTLSVGMTTQTITPLLRNLILADSTSTGNNTRPEYEPMLSRPLDSSKTLESFCEKVGGRVYADIKFDGERTMIFFDRDKPEGERVFLQSRNKKSQHKMYPDLVAAIEKQLVEKDMLQSCVLDGEIVTVKKGSLVPTSCQLLMSRKGKQRQDSLDSEYTEKVMVFDVLEIDRQPLISLAYESRIGRIPRFGVQHTLVNVEPQPFQIPQQKQQLLKYFESVLDQGHEGLMLKSAVSTYDISGGRKDWAKLKKGIMVEGDPQSFKAYDFDLVLMGADSGRGKYRDWLASYLFGVFDPRSGCYLPVSKVGTGLNFEQIKSLTEQSKELIVPAKPSNYLVPDKLKVEHWISPALVYEIACQGLSRSPLYRIGSQQGEGGISLRFPRFVRRREDKDPGQCSTTQELQELMSVDQRL